jgi:hypothetical protein
VSRRSSSRRPGPGSLALSLGLIAGLVAALVPAQGEAPGGGPSPTATAGDSAPTPACNRAKRRVTRSRAALTRARQALRNSVTPAAEGRARKRVQRAKRALAGARRRRTNACGNPGPPPDPGNRPPQFPDPMSTSVSTQSHHDPNNSSMSGATTTMTVSSPATDPDGDPVTYSWTASNGSIAPNGLSAVWTRVISAGDPVPGQAVITASDGRGGTDTFTFVLD